MVTEEQHAAVVAENIPLRRHITEPPGSASGICPDHRVLPLTMPRRGDATNVVTLTSKDEERRVQTSASLVELAIIRPLVARQACTS